ncbi:EAL domain-containing protein [Bacillus sp. FJAT-50079]|uniref:EAL domain-containing protein n=1 Tax=Bacillus sp. FJAT-50079 TaxID=2833577 RepID=UPI001BC9F620|nr:EAL domain-containing protein [Bacillus sp. FJAT-50079]MBS4208571.1 EAL domain-containing protein [Bacillus sp. FJAT-50079]
MLSKLSKTKKLQEYLEKEKHSYPHIFEQSPNILLFVIDVNGMIVKLRAGLNHLAGLQINDFVGKPYEEFIYKDDLKIVEDCFQKVLGGKSQYATYRIKHDEIIIHIDVTLVPIQLDDGEVIGFYGLTHNITDLHKLENKIQEKNERYESLMNLSHEMIGILSPDGTIIFENPSVETILGYKVNEISGKSLFQFIHPDDLPYMTNKLKDLLNHPKTTIRSELRLVRKDGTWRDFEIMCTNLLSHSSINGIICNFHDITEKKRQQRKIHYLAYHDYLTKLPNRRAFEDRVDLEIQLANGDQRKFAVMFLDLDGFKFLNDSLGHDIGDLLIIEIANTLHDLFKKNIEMIARLGGDEFAILASNIDELAAIEHLAENILKRFKLPFNVKNFNLFITASIGISTYPESGTHTHSLMKNADLALYLAEKEGRNRFHLFSPTANIATYKVFSLRNEIRQALHNNQFIIYYQPIVHTESNQIVNAEALLRWNHPDWGIVSPREFIPLAEESGLIVPLGDWILKNVCKQVRLWHEQGYFIKASVNLSIIQFFKANFIENVKEILLESKLEAKWLELEITESTMLEQEDDVLEKIRQLREMGIQIALDDFGTGYSSLESLRKIKPDTLKLDRSFIKEVTTNKDSENIVTFMINLAKSLDISIVAEGVETSEQQQLLADLQCHRLQGYLFSKPVPEAEFKKLLKEQAFSSPLPQMQNERRSYARIQLEPPLEALMTIAEINGKIVHLGNTKVLIENIGLGGLCFLSSIHLPVRSDVILKFQVQLANQMLVLFGITVWGEEYKNNHRYGLQFIIDEKQRNELRKLFDHL